MVFPCLPYILNYLLTAGFCQRGLSPPLPGDTPWGWLLLGKSHAMVYLLSSARKARTISLPSGGPRRKGRKWSRGVWETVLHVPCAPAKSQANCSVATVQTHGNWRDLSRKPASATCWRQQLCLSFNPMLLDANSETLYRCLFSGTKVAGGFLLCFQCKVILIREARGFGSKCLTFPSESTLRGWGRSSFSGKEPLHRVLKLIFRFTFP